jgi:DNA-binding HxlR family transcriptional regulator
MRTEKRSGCPISFSLELLGDRWTCLVLRDLVFRQRRYFQEFLASPEGIATNVLAERLNRLEARGIIRKEPDPDDRRRSVYSLTEAGLDLIPLLVELTIWGATHDPESTYPRERLARFQGDREGTIAHFRAKAAPPLEHAPSPAANDPAA